MAIKVDKPISWETAKEDDAAMLANLQANILRPHPRDFMVLLFLQFTDANKGRAFLKEIAGWVKSARQHLNETKAFKDHDRSGTPYLGVGLTAAGYRKLDIKLAPLDPSFQGGMQQAKLEDPPPATWDLHFQQPDDLHAVLLIGHKGDAPVCELRNRIMDKITASAGGVVVRGQQDGSAIPEKKGGGGGGIEHFGYADGGSQPLFFEEDIAEERRAMNGANLWDPEFPLKQAIVPDRAAPDIRIHFGSYLVLRKLEQNVKLFKQQEKDFFNALAAASGAPMAANNAQRVCASLMGRFTDGTPVTLQDTSGAVTNNFDYQSDKMGTKCPVFSHIRKTNPRNGPIERSRVMPRRGQTYGERLDDPRDDDIDSKPTGGVGLLFMAFNSNIAHQFEFIQHGWASNPDFPTVGAGVDPIIGQVPAAKLPPHAPPLQVECPVTWGSAAPGNMVKVNPMQQTVTMKGGEYFFMPSLAFLHSL